MTSVAGMQKARTTRKEYRMEEEEEIRLRGYTGTGPCRG